MRKPGASPSGVWEAVAQSRPLEGPAARSHADSRGHCMRAHPQENVPSVDLAASGGNQMTMEGARTNRSVFRRIQEEGLPVKHVKSDTRYELGEKGLEVREEYRPIHLGLTRSGPKVPCHQQSYPSWTLRSQKRIS